MVSRKPSARKYTSKRPRRPLGVQTPRSRPRNKEDGQPQRRRPGEVVALEIERYQGSNELIIPRLPFQRLVREIGQDKKPGLRFQPEALDMLQRSAEDYIVSFFKDSKLVAAHGKRMTLQPKDIYLAKRLHQL